MNFVVKSKSDKFQGLYLRKITPHSVYWTDYPLAAQYFPEENEARVTMIEAGLYSYDVIEAPVCKERQLFKPSSNPVFGAIREAAANSRI